MDKKEKAKLQRLKAKEKRSLSKIEREFGEGTDAVMKKFEEEMLDSQEFKDIILNATGPEDFEKAFDFLEANCTRMLKAHIEERRNNHESKYKIIGD